MQKHRKSPFLKFRWVYIPSKALKSAFIIYIKYCKSIIFFSQLIIRSNGSNLINFGLCLVLICLALSIFSRLLSTLFWRLVSIPGCLIVFILHVLCFIGHPVHSIFGSLRGVLGLLCSISKQAINQSRNSIKDRGCHVCCGIKHATCKFRRCAKDSYCQVSCCAQRVRRKTC